MRYRIRHGLVNSLDKEKSNIETQVKTEIYEKQTLIWKMNRSGLKQMNEKIRRSWRKKTSVTTEAYEKTVTLEITRDKTDT